MIFPSPGLFLTNGMALPHGYPSIAHGVYFACDAYNEVSAYDALWFVSHTILGATVWIGGVVSERMGEPSGRLITTVATVYESLFVAAVGFLTL